MALTSHDMRCLFLGHYQKNLVQLVRQQASFASRCGQERQVCHFLQTKRVNKRSHPYLFVTLSIGRKKKLAQGSQMHVQLSKLHHFVMLPCCWAFYVVQADVPNSLWKTGTHDHNLKAFRLYGTRCWNYTHVKKLPTSGNIFLGGSNNMNKKNSFQCE